MKKIIALSLAVLLCFSLYACGEQKANSAWSVTQTVDEFGDVTADSAEVITGTFSGTFSNTATSGSEVTVVVSIGKKAKFNHYIIGFDLKEYNNASATYLSSDSKIFKMKTNEEVITMDLSGTEPNGTLYLSGENYEWEGDLLFNELLKGNDVKCIVNIGSSEYNFTLISDNLTALCSENNIPEGITELTVAEAVNMLLEDSGEYTEVAEECIESNIDKYELLNTDSLNKYLNGYFLEIGPGYSYVGDYVYNNWQIYEFSPNKQTISLKATYNTSINSSRRTYSIATEKELPKATFENDLIIEHYSKTDKSFSYQCRKISDDIFMLCILSEGEFVPSSLLLKINGESIEQDVNYIMDNNLSKIIF